MPGFSSPAQPMPLPRQGSAATTLKVCASSVFLSYSHESCCLFLLPRRILHQCSIPPVKSIGILRPRSIRQILIPRQAGRLADQESRSLTGNMPVHPPHIGFAAMAIGNCIIMNLQISPPGSFFICIIPAAGFSMGNMFAGRRNPGLFHSG